MPVVPQSMSAPDHLIDNILVFFGGFLLSLTHPFSSTLLILSTSYTDVAFFVLRSLIGGALALLGKVGIEWCIKKFKSRKNSKQK